MPDPNKRNLLYFESDTMQGLYEDMDAWQDTNQKRLLSVSVQKDGGKFCCIALTNPTEVVIVHGGGGLYAEVHSGCLRVADM
jgi:hypothetical protein